MNKLDISVVVPLYNEAESLPELVAWIDRVAVEKTTFPLWIKTM